MRNLPPRPAIPNDVQAKLQAKTREISAIADLRNKTSRARVVFESARKADWFGPIVSALRGLCGPGELCMYCSSNEPSQIEHYRPSSVFPESALEYENYVWSCDICNRKKLDRFPPDTEAGDFILNPLNDNVWDYFFLDEQFGRLISRIEPISKVPHSRASSTCSVVGIDRENVQIKRLHRYNVYAKTFRLPLTISVLVNCRRATFTQS